MDPLLRHGYRPHFSAAARLIAARASIRMDERRCLFGEAVSLTVVCKFRDRLDC